jgi:O-acetyl-ADP-ribose deacetylase
MLIMYTKIRRSKSTEGKLMKLLKYTAIIALGVQGTYAQISIEARKGDITKRTDDAIVNAANKHLKGGGGVCGAIFNAAGWSKLQEACDKIPSTQDIRCPVGEARITDSFDLKKQGIKYIIHAVGPDGRQIKDQEQQKKLLEKAYTASLDLASKHKLKSIAFPFISSGIYKIDADLAAKAAVHACMSYSYHHKTSLEKIRFVLFSDADYELFSKIIRDHQGKK